METESEAPIRGQDLELCVGVRTNVGAASSRRPLPGGPALGVRGRASNAIFSFHGGSVGVAAPLVVMGHQPSPSATWAATDKRRPNQSSGGMFSTAMSKDGVWYRLGLAASWSPRAA